LCAPGTVPPGLPLVTGRKAMVLALRSPHDANTLASGGMAAPVLLWDTAEGRLRSTLPEHEGGVTCLDFSPDGTTLAAGSGVSGKHGEVKLWDVAGGRLLRSWQGHAGEILRLSYRPDGRVLARASEDGAVRVWAPATKQEQAVLKGTLGELATVAFGPDGKTVAAGGATKDGSGAVWLWDDAGGEPRLLEGHGTSVWM